MKKQYTTLALCGLLLLPVVAQAGISTFEDLSLAPNTYWNGETDGHQNFVSNGFSFTNYKMASWNYWEGFAYSNMTDTTTAGYTNQFSAITGGGVKGSANYGVAYAYNMSGPTPTATLFKADGQPWSVDGVYVTNTTYAYLSMRHGDGFAKAFGGQDGSDADWFKLTTHALGADHKRTGASVDFYLADFRFENSADDYILDQWAWMDLSSLGQVHGLEFRLSSSDVGKWGMNTPAYFAMDAAPVPVPGAIWLVGAGLLGLSAAGRRRSV